MAHWFQSLKSFTPRLGHRFGRRPHGQAARIVDLVSSRPHYVAAILIALYLLFLQTKFVFTGDTWAEAYSEYLATALATGWQGFFNLGWAGYFNFIPRFLVNLYLWLHLPVGSIDYFFRGSVIMFAAACVIFIAHPYNRPVIKNDYLRIFAALATILTLNHVSSFSFINVWYIGFVVVALVSLHDQKFKHESTATAYVALAMAICLTKPSIILLPLVLYRTIRLKEYLVGFIIGFAIILETLLLMSSSFLAQPINVDVGLKLKAATLSLGTGLMWLKTFSIYPAGLWAVVIGFVIVGAASIIVLIWGQKIWRSLAIFLSLGLGVYTYFIAPDVMTPSVLHGFAAIFRDQFKLQREVMVSFFLILITVMAIDLLIARYRVVLRRSIWPPVGVALILSGLLASAYRPIDVQGSAQGVDLTQFRSDLNRHVSSCMPVAPTPSDRNAQGVVGHQTAWFFAYYGGCIELNNGTKTFSQARLTRPLEAGWKFAAPGGSDRQIKSLLIPVINPRPNIERQLILRDEETGQAFRARVQAKANGEQLSFVAFNTSAEPPQGMYNFSLGEPGSPHSDMRVGRFVEGDSAYYAFYMGVPNLGDYGHVQARLKNRQP